MLSRDHEITSPVDGPVKTAGRPPERRKSRGQSLVEFAVLLPILVMILALAADFGRGLTAFITISSAAREGAAFGMLSPDRAANATAIRAVVLADSGEIWGTTPTVSSSFGPDPVGTDYDRVTVTVTYAFTPLIPIPGLPSTITMERTVAMRVLE